MALDHFIEGLDPTAIPGQITKADLLELIRAAKPVVTEGMLHYAEDAPDVIANPELATFWWIKVDGDGDPIGEIYWYKDGSWQLIPIVNGALLAPGTVGLSKLDLTSSSPYDIIQVDAGGTNLEYVSIPNAIQDDTIPTSKLVAPDNTYDYILTCLAGTKAFTLIANVWNYLADNTLAIAKLVRGGADTLGLYLRTKLDGTGTEWANVDVANLAATGYIAGQSIRRNGTNTAWEAFTAAVGGSTLVYNKWDNGGAGWAVPTAAVQDITHNLGQVPFLARVVLEVAAGLGPFAGYADGSQIDISNFIGQKNAGDDVRPAFTVAADTTKIYVVPNTDIAGIYIVDKNLKLHVDVDTSKFIVKAFTLSL